MNHVALGLCFFVLASAIPLGSVTSRAEIEYYVAAYAAHYQLPLGFVRALIAQESGWRPCALSKKGAAGLMQLMPETRRLLHVDDACDVRQNLSAGMRYLAYLREKFQGDLRLVAAAYFAGEAAVSRRGLEYSNREVVAYVAAIGRNMAVQRAARSGRLQPGRLP